MFLPCDPDPPNPKSEHDVLCAFAPNEYGSRDPLFPNALFSSALLSPDLLSRKYVLYRYKQLRGIVEDAVGERELPPDLPSDDKLIAAGAAASVAAGAAAGDPEALAALKGNAANITC